MYLSLSKGSNCCCGFLIRLFCRGVPLIRCGVLLLRRGGLLPCLLCTGGLLLCLLRHGGLLLCLLRCGGLLPCLLRTGVLLLCLLHRGGLLPCLLCTGGLLLCLLCRGGLLPGLLRTGGFLLCLLRRGSARLTSHLPHYRLPLYNVLLIVFLNCKLLWIKASAKLINVNVTNAVPARYDLAWVYVTQRFAKKFDKTASV